MHLNNKTWTLTAIATDATGETNLVEGSPDNQGWVVFSIKVTGTITIGFFSAIDPAVPIAALGMPVGASVGVLTTTTDGIFRVESTGCKVKAKVTAVAGGNAVVLICHASTAGG